MIINPYIFGATYNPLTTAWILATGESNLTIIGALNDFEQGLIDNSMTSDLIAFYPMVGGTATKHKYNFMNAVDSDAAYRLLFYGGWTHSSTGALPNGSTGYADTFINVNTALSLNDTHLGYYSRTQSTIGAVEIGAYDTHFTQLVISFSGTMAMIVNSSTVGTVFPNTTSKGFAISNRRASNVENGWLGGTKIVETATASTGKANRNLYIGARNSGGTANLFTDRECAMITVGKSLTDSKAGILTGLVNAFQTTLGRNV